MPSTTSRVGFDRLGFFDRDGAVLADLVHRVGDDLADRQRRQFAETVATCAISCVSLTFLAMLLEFLDERLRRPCRCRA
jgi:hypothetical protein